MKKDTIRIATYNVHKCRGLDGRVRPERIAEVLGEIDADIMALQEVISEPDRRGGDDQAGFLAREMGLKFVLGETRRRNGRPYGNLLLSRFPIRAVANYDISAPGREPRGCLRADLGVDRYTPPHTFTVPVRPSDREARHRAPRLPAPPTLGHPWLNGPSIVLGVLNEWPRGRAPRLLAARLKTVDVRAHLGHRRTYPGILPLVYLDHIYFDPHFEVKKLELHRTSTALVASDHLPLVAEMRMLHHSDSGHHHHTHPAEARHHSRVA